MKRPPAKERNSLGRFQDSWYLQESASAGGPTANVFMPPKWGRWKFRSYVKRGRLHFYSDGGTMFGERLREWGDTLEKVQEKTRARQRKLDQHGQLANALTTHQQYVAAQIFLIAESLNVDPLVIVRDYQARHPLGGAARTLDQVRQELIAIKHRGERREVYVRGLGYRFRKLIEAFGDIPVSTVTTAMLTQELNRHLEWKSGTIHGVVTGWKVIFNYAVDQGYALSNPCDKLQLPRRRRAKPELLPAKLVHRLLAGCITHPHMAPCLAYVAIGCFTGIRPEEMQRLRWEMIDLDAGYITIDGENAKCGERGIVKIHPNLIGWIRPIARTSGPVLKRPVATLRTLCREFLSKFLSGKCWPHDCMRHGYASFHYGYFRDISEVCANLRHGTGQLVFINHYYIPRPPAECVYFWTMIVRPVALLTA